MGRPRSRDRYRVVWDCTFVDKLCGSRSSDFVPRDMKLRMIHSIDTLFMHCIKLCRPRPRDTQNVSRRAELHIYDY